MAFAQLSVILTFAVIFQGGLHPTIGMWYEINFLVLFMESNLKINENIFFYYKAKILLIFYYLVGIRKLQVMRSIT